MARKPRPQVTEVTDVAYPSGGHVVLKTPAQAQKYLREFGEHLRSNLKWFEGELVLRSMELLCNEITRPKRPRRKAKIVKPKSANTPER